MEKYRKIRLAWSVVWGVFSIGFGALWLRSYWRSDVFSPRFTKTTALSRGQFYSNADCAWRDQHTRHLQLSGQTYDLMITDIWAPGAGSIDIMHYGIRVPLWPAVIVLPIVAVTPWLRSPHKLRFSVRSLLIGTALIAIALGVIVFLVHIG